ncbi:hypothetical protein HFQ13_09425 [Acidithiobacillus sp. VAN18-1]|uniref:Uncharacterized protein n=1 Tax=Igneacidithiobacillus copahuensis TaxID=2724909 RepID=A0AAE2YQH6_9PROT|nr:hypothetical protein [Igneacidithiobacillus copahuensis]MBU2788416.1 hypothetical protein [Igneacidithiobacillus copahuensis]MBU2796915.1 hypothetical protein [Acidithiobacillus sp. VAN18-2]
MMDLSEEKVTVQAFQDSVIMELELTIMTNHSYLLDWVRHTAEHIRRTVSATPYVRLMPYRHRVVALDYFDRPECTGGKSLALTVFISGGNNYSLGKLKDHEDETEINVPRTMDVLLIISMIGKALNPESPVCLKLAV